MAHFRDSEFFQHFNHQQLLDTINMQNQQKLMHIDQENGLKPYLRPFLAMNGPFLAQIFSRKSGFVTLLHSEKGNFL